jgi:hypothetical protein
MPAADASCSCDQPIKVRALSAVLKFEVQRSPPHLTTPNNSIAVQNVTVSALVCEPRATEPAVQIVIASPPVRLETIRHRCFGRIQNG